MLNIGIAKASTLMTQVFAQNCSKNIGYGKHVHISHVYSGDHAEFFEASEPTRDCIARDIHASGDFCPSQQGSSKDGLQKGVLSGVWANSVVIERQDHGRLSE